MIVRYGADALAREDAWPCLTEIFEFFVKGRHHWWVPESHEVLESKWFQSRGPHNQRRVRTQVDRGAKFLRATQDHPSVLVQYSGGDKGAEWILTPDEAVRMLRLPVRIVVENIESDGAFIRSVLLCFGRQKLKAILGEEESKRLVSQWNVGGSGDGEFFRVVNGGGSSIGGVVTAEWRTVQSSMLALVDSDREAPPSAAGPKKPSTWASTKTAIEALVTDRMPHLFVLGRREMENYVPVGALKERFGQQHAKTRACVEAYARQCKSRRAYFDLKRGLGRSVKNPDTTPEAWEWKDGAVGDLWRTATNADLKPLQTGLGDNVWECWTQDEKTINRSTMRDEAGDELKTLVDEITDLL